MQTLFTLSEFSSAIELATTLNIAFVAVEYVKTYTKVLCDQVFNLKRFIQQIFDICKSTLPDQGTLSTIPNITINNHNIDEIVEGFKRERERLLEEIQKTKDRHEALINDVCEAKNVSSISLFLFFIGVSALFLIGFETRYPSIVRYLWSFLSVSSVIYCFIGWISSEESKKRFLNFESLRHAIICFIFVLIITCLALIWKDYVDNIVLAIWNPILPASILFNFSNFIVASAKIWHKARGTKDEIKKSQEKIVEKCNSLRKNVESVISVNDLTNDLYQTN